MDKFDDPKYSEKDLRQRFRYLRLLPDIIKNPDEIWDRPTDGKLRSNFIKVLDHNVVLVFERDSGHFAYFNILLYTDLSSIRSGILRYSKSPL